jgi:hypothetical protein
MDIKVIYPSTIDYSLIGDDKVPKMDFAPPPPGELLHSKSPSIHKTIGNPCLLGGITMAHLSLGCLLMGEQLST